MSVGQQVYIPGRPFNDMLDIQLKFKAYDLQSKRNIYLDIQVKFQVYMTHDLKWIAIQKIPFWNIFRISSWIHDHELLNALGV